MSLAVFLHAHADEDHEHDKSDDAFLFRGENEQLHSRLIRRDRLVFWKREEYVDYKLSTNALARE